MVVGCNGYWLSRPELRNPFRRSPPVDQARYGPTPAERTSELRDLAERTQRMPATQQQAVSQQLAARLPQESDPILRGELVR